MAVLVSPDWVRMMAEYNAAMNRSLYEAAGRLDDAERKRARGAFWGSLHGTFCHLLWADMMWMSRLAGWPRPPVALPQSAMLEPDFAVLRTRREATDAAIADWAAGIDDAALAGELKWFSGAIQADVVRPRALVVTHLFNHQTHHRGQAHALLTQSGQSTGDTDLFILVAA
jgi:uncharacterized damage-inducible protein DinB